MKMKLLALAISGLALPVASLAGPTVYGTVDLSLDVVDMASTTVTANVENNDNIQLTSNWAQIGVKGSADLTDGLTGVYNANFNVNYDEGGLIISEVMYAGVRGTWGELIAGSMYSPLSNIQGSIDKFDWHNGDMLVTFDADDANTENVISNLVNYTSPSMNGLHFSLGLQLGEESTEDDGDEARDGLDGLSGAVVFNHDSGLYLALGMDSELSEGGETWDAMRLAASYTLEGVDLGAVYQTSEASEDGTETTSFLVSAATAVSNEVTARVQYQQSELDVDGAEAQSVISLGADYALGQATGLYAEYNLTDDGNNDGSVISLGMRHQF